MAACTVYLGAAPPDEPGVQPGDPHFRERNLAECSAYVQAIRRSAGEPPEGAKLYAKLGDYPFGQAREVVLEFDDADEPACRYAQYCQALGPRTWADAGIRLSDGRGR